MILLKFVDHFFLVKKRKEFYLCKGYFGEWSEAWG